MLGKTAGGLYWMFRFLERAENTARMVEAGFRIALTRSTDAEAEWKSIIVSSAAQAGYEAKHAGYDGTRVIDYLLRDAENPSSVLSGIKQARDNARLTRTALTTEVWTAVNETWMLLCDVLAEPIPVTELPQVLSTIRQQSALVRGALHGTMLRNDIYDFCRIGTFIERADNTVRIVDVKYHTLLPSASLVGSRLDNVQWETVLRSVSAYRSFRWAVEGEMTAANIAHFLILDRRMPRSVAFSLGQLVSNLNYIADDYGVTTQSYEMAQALRTRVKDRDVASIFEEGLHEFLSTILGEVSTLALQIEQDFRFNS